jgi:diguanylate cyclase (GGDEF)-like protein
MRATTDELTGLINRREFERVSDIALDNAEREGAGLCVMVIDLNGFKQINDTLGHQFGDLVLAASSERLVAAVRDSDVVARWGGDEFVILLPTLAERSAVRTSAERIWHSLADNPVVGDTHMTASIGAAIFPRHGTTLDALMRAADVAMYEAKTTGVSHRIADTIATSESMLADDTGPLQVIEVITDEYAGPDRRHSPVPPPMRPPGELRRPTVPEVPLRTASSSERAAPDEAHIR